MNLFQALAILMFVSCAQQAPGQEREDIMEVFFDRYYSSDSVRKSIVVLTSDSLEGRETGELGQRRAANFLSKHMEMYGFSGLGDGGSHIQRYPMLEVMHRYAWLSARNDTLQMLKDFYSFSMIVDSSVAANGIVFLGYGIHDDRFSNYKAAGNLKGKAVVIANGEPEKEGKFILSGGIIPSAWSDGYDAKIEVAKSSGASMVFIVQEAFDRNLPRVTNYLKKPKLRLDAPDSSVLPVVFIGPATFNILFGAGSWETACLENNLAQPSFRLQNSIDLKFHMKKGLREVWAENVVACSRGEVFPDEYVVISAHFDHLGKRGEDIFRGADDNGSGTAAVMEMARLLHLAKSSGYVQKRSVLFAFFSGEEKGLLGSEYFVRNPPVPLSQLVADLNVDMIGRRDAAQPVDEEYIYLIGSDKLSLELHQISEVANATYSQLKLDYKYNDPADPQRLYYRSDHYNFARHRIPVVFYFRGLHEDYHKTTDTVEKLNFDSMKRVTELIFYTKLALLDLDHKPVIDEEIR